MLRRLLLTTAALAALTTAANAAVTTSMTITADGVPTTFNSVDGTLNITNQALGVFDLNTVSINAGPSFVAAPGVLRTNTLNIDLDTGGNHTLVVDLIANGLTGLGGLTDFLSTFSVSGLTAGWTVREQTFINGNQL